MTLQEFLAQTPQYKINELKAQLAATDYKAIKHSEGLISDEEYEPTKQERQAIRERINALEAQMKGEPDHA